MISKDNMPTYTDDEIYKLAETINTSWRHKNDKERKEGIELELKVIQLNSSPEMVARLREQLDKMKPKSMTQNEREVSEIIQRAQDEINLELKEKLPSAPTHKVKAKVQEEVIGKPPEFNEAAFNARLKADEAWDKAEKAVAKWKSIPTDKNRASAMRSLENTRDLVNKARILEGSPPLSQRKQSPVVMTAPVQRTTEAQQPVAGSKFAKAVFDIFMQLKNAALDLVKQFRQNKTEVNKNRALSGVRIARQSLAIHHKVKKLDGAVAGNQQQMALINKLKSELPKIQRLEKKALNMAKQYRKNKTPGARRSAVTAMRELRQAKSTFRKVKKSLVKQQRLALKKPAGREQSSRSHFRSGPK